MNKQNGIKLHSDEQVHIITNDDNIKITIGPVIDRLNLCSSYYNVIIMFDDNNSNDNNSYDNNESNESTNLNNSREFKSKFINICNLYFAHIMNTKYIYKTNYNTFKKYFKISHLEKINNMCKTLSEQELLDDLDFIKSQFKKYRIIMEKNKDINIEKYNMINHMLSHEQYKMFQLSSNDQFEKYLDEITKIIEKQKLIKNEEIKEDVEAIIEITKRIFNDNNNDEYDNNTTDTDNYSVSDSDSNSEYSDNNNNVCHNDDDNIYHNDNSNNKHNGIQNDDDNNK